MERHKHNSKGNGPNILLIALSIVIIITLAIISRIILDKVNPGLLQNRTINEKTDYNWSVNYSYEDSK